MKHKIALMAGLALAVLIGAGVLYSQQKSRSAASQQEKIAALQELRDSGVITAQEYETKVKALQASAPAASATSAPAHSAKVGWSSTHSVEIVDPAYQMTAYKLEIPTGWKFAGTIARPTGCHSHGLGIKLTTQSPDGLTAMVSLPPVAWAWSNSASMQKIMEQQHCPSIDIDTAASFLVNIAVPNLRPDAKVVEVVPVPPELQASLADDLEKARQQAAELARQFNSQPQKITLEGAFARIQYARDGQPVEEMIGAVVQCTESTPPAVMNQPAYQMRNCFTRGTSITRAPQGHVDELMASPQFKSLLKAVVPNPDWQKRNFQAALQAQRDQQASFEKMQADNNRQFQNLLKAGQDANDRLLENGRAFNANLQANTDRVMAADRARQDAIDASAHNMALYAGDRQEFKNPSTGQTIQASNQYNHQWVSSDGQTLIQTNDHSYDPNGKVDPINTSWTELVAK